MSKVEKARTNEKNILVQMSKVEKARTNEKMTLFTNIHHFNFRLA